MNGNEERGISDLYLEWLSNDESVANSVALSSAGTERVGAATFGAGVSFWGSGSMGSEYERIGFRPEALDHIRDMALEIKNFQKVFEEYKDFVSKTQESWKGIASEIFRHTVIENIKKYEEIRDIALNVNKTIEQQLMTAIEHEGKSANDYKSNLPDRVNNY